MAMAWHGHGMAMAWPRHAMAWHGHAMPGYGHAMPWHDHWKTKIQGCFFCQISIRLGQRLRRTAGNRGALMIRGAPDPKTPKYINKSKKNSRSTAPMGNIL